MNRTKLTVLALLGLAACSGEITGSDTPDASVPTYKDCAGSDQAFVRDTYLALLGRRPASQAEVLVYTEIMAQTRALAAAATAGDAGAGPALDPREVVTRAIMALPGFTEHWADHFMDAMKTPRIEDQSQGSCFGTSLRSASQGISDGGLAKYLRDHDARATGDGLGSFTMLDVLRSSVALDDVSVLYRANLFALVSRPIPAANVGPVEAELARREDFGNVFDSSYLNRDLVCLGCHNSEMSVTFSDDPKQNRHWPLHGFLEKAIYGASTAEPAAQAHAPFRFDGFSLGGFGGGGGVTPWGADPGCGEFTPDNLVPDPAAIDGKFGNLTGQTLTVFDLEASLQRGVDSLAKQGLVVAADGSVTDPDQAFAYLTAMSIVESVWREVVGSPLTIANYFPRNQAARDVLQQLTDDFVRSHFSLKTLLLDIVESDYWNRLPPEAGCGAAPYDMPNIFDPWVTSDADPLRRQNGAGDGVVALSARTLLRAAFTALDWPRPAYWDFPDGGSFSDFCTQTYTCDQMNAVCMQDGTCCDSYQAYCVGGSTLTPDQVLSFQKGVGVFLKHGERGFRGLDFQARLVYEDVFGACKNPGDGADFVAALVARAQSTTGATVGDVVAALKDRLIGQARVSNDGGALAEISLLAKLFGVPLDTPAAGLADLEARARALCGVLMSSPQFLQSGLAPPDSSYVPLLTPAEAGFDSICNNVMLLGLPDGLTVDCGNGDLTVKTGAAP